MKRRYVDTGHLPGILSQVWRRGSCPYRHVRHMDLERNKPMRDDALFRIYSMSKPITAVALMMLAEEGMIGLDDEVAAHIPSWRNLGVYSTGLPSIIATGGPVPHHAAGAADEGGGPGHPHIGPDLWFMNRTNVDARIGAPRSPTRQPRAAWMRWSSSWRFPLEFSPGTAWNYSVSIDVMGYLVQKLSGLSFGEFLRTRLFEPLGMRDTAFWCPEEKIGRFASCYLPKAGGGLQVQDDAGASTYAKPPNLESGGGGLVSTAHDYLRFCRMMLNGGSLDGMQILSPKTVALFSLNHLPTTWRSGNDGDARCVQ